MKKSLLVLSMALVFFVCGASLAFAAVDPYGTILPSDNSELNSDSGKFGDGSSLRIEENENKNLGYIVKGNYAKFSAVDFGADGAAKVKIEVATPNAAGSIAFLADDPKGTPFATVNYEPSGDWQKYQWFEAPVTGLTGAHDLYVVFTDGDINVRGISFEAAGGGGEAEPAANPATGDNGIMLYAILAVAAAGAIVLSRKSLARRQH
ncbi:carbohydrate-binding protein [Cohnella lupini]|uniref:Carbohydrate binding protein with CBM6 domain n=1 Tax=Cohnella lupini TaxID=1294267 RepID=A0A3D9IT45_9BACL|nr:carbohydrate-binding protein [Cohnella lupini]RED64963.1 carbohydrate binding protein with CBM6 domain [Cohnella lupini]